jgi:hypothetical protein
VTRSARALSALACTAALVVSGVAPAAAVDWLHHDAVGDVQSVTFKDNSSKEPDFVPNPGNVDTDVTQLMLRHRTHRVALRMTMQDIQRSSGIAIFDIRTDGRDYIAVKTLGRRWFKPGWMLMRANGRPVRCPDVRRKVDRTANEVIARIPRRCLGSPQWVRVGAGAQSFEEGRRSFTVHLDDALSEGDIRDRLTMSPRVRRG